MRKTVSSEIKKELNNLRIENQELKHKLAELQSVKALESTEITQREKSVLEYVGRNPGVNKQHVIDWGESPDIAIGSRVTIMNAISSLHNSGMIKVEKDKPNSTVHKLYVNQDSVLVLLIQELDTFENVFPLLIEKVKNKLKGKDLSKIPYGCQNEITFFIYFFVVYQQFIGMLVLHALHTWPARLNDELTLKRLYAILFSRLRKIQLNLTNTFDFRSDSRYAYSVDILATMAQLWFVLNPSYMKYLLSSAKEYDAVTEIENIFDVVWKISKPFFKYSMWAHLPPSEKQKESSSSMYYLDQSSKQLDKLKPEDWREALGKW